jgi:hypothetical protein
MNYCSPQQGKRYNETGSCYDKTVLEKIARAFNRSFPDKSIQQIETKTFSQLWKELQKKLSVSCGRDEVCWVSKVGLDYDDKLEDYIRPKTPAEWKRDPKTWLNNFNIEAVLIQYEEANSPIYKFMGVYPSDFLRKESYSGDCYYEEICKLNVAELYKQGITCIGMVINLDEHDEPGSHWTSMFACIDPTKQCFGAYYYDSVTGDPPEDMLEFMQEIQRQADQLKASLKIKKPFKIAINKVRHQYGHSECGVFSIYYQLKWLSEIKNKGGKVKFEDIVGKKITDSQVFKLREILFRPLYQFKKSDVQKK